MRLIDKSISNFDGAIRGMRNPLESWDKSDSKSTVFIDTESDYERFRQEVSEVAQTYLVNSNASDEEADEVLDDIREWLLCNSGLAWFSDDRASIEFLLGYDDLRVAQNLILAGAASHRKFLRQIQVCFDLEAPMYFWKEFDTYKVGTTRNSTSTMHKLATTPITKDCFSFDNGYQWHIEGDNHIDIRDEVIELCEHLRQKYLEIKDKAYWRALIQLIPNGWNQRSTITLNYEVLRTMYFDRRNHKLIEWQNFCRWIESLPYAKELITITKESREEKVWLVK